MGELALAGEKPHEPQGQRALDRIFGVSALGVGREEVLREVNVQIFRKLCVNELFDILAIALDTHEIDGPQVIGVIVG